MGTEEKPSPDSKEVKVVSKDLDWFLQILVDWTNGTETGIGITLNVGGLLISGELVSGHRYFNGFTEDMEEAIKKSSKEPLKEQPLKVISDIRKLGDIYRRDYDNPEKDSEKPLPLLIHLRNAKMFHPGGKPIPANRGAWWRGRLESVDGFILGSLSAE